MAKIVFALIALGNHLVSKRKQLVLHSFPDVEDQMVAMVRWLRDHPEQRLPVILLVSGDEGEALRRMRLLVGVYASDIHIFQKAKLRAIWAYWRSRYVFITHGLYGFFPVPERQCVVNLWHGMPLKRIWSGMPGSHVPPCTWLLSTSDKFSEVLAKASGLSVDRIPAIGLPRNDLLFSRTPAAERFAAGVRAGVQRVILFLPTYRQSRHGFITHDGQETANALAMSEEDIGKLQGWLVKNKTRMLVKPHPMSVHYGRDSRLSECLWIISDAWMQEQGLTLYEALGQMDGLITDVSSVYVDFLALRRPIFFYFPDLEDYRRTRSFLLEPIEKWLAGPLCGTAAALITAMQESKDGADGFCSQRKRLAEILNSQAGPDSAGKTFAFIGIQNG